MRRAECEARPIGYVAEVDADARGRPIRRLCAPWPDAVRDVAESPDCMIRSPSGTRLTRRLHCR